jgi:ribonuclease PH
MADARPIGVFDSGVGGLTVLHECLVTMPHEDFVYLGDHARLPYGPRSRDEVRRFAHEIGSYLERQGVKMVVVACNTATSVALPDLQEQLTVPVVSVIVPEAHAAVQATRNRQIGLLATELTVASGRYQSLVHTLDAGAHVTAVPCPKLVPLIEAGDTYSDEIVAAVREYAVRLKDAGCDTIILGCTHYPLLRPVFQRTFGRDVTLVFSADETAREVAETLARKGFDNDASREGVYRFLTTGDLPLARRAVSAVAARRRRAGPRRRIGGRMSRNDGRRPDQLRPIEADPSFLEQPHGVVLWSQGKTRVLCTASVQEGVPRWLYRSGRGWMTAEYSLLPASTGERTDREAARGKQGGRTVEIQRLIGRALRGVVDFQALGERTVYLDCDVLQADGGTRCAAITGAYVAASRALDRFGLSKALTGGVAAVSVGVVEGTSLLDLDYSEDSNADVDVNVVMTHDGRFVEVQSTAEQVPFDRARLDELLDLAAVGVEDLQRSQEEAIAAPRE